MVQSRDFLNASTVHAYGTSVDELTTLMSEQSDLLAQIAYNLRIQNSDVLATAVVKGASQITNLITDLNVHEVFFEVGGKPVTIHKLLVFSTYNKDITISPVRIANYTDGMIFSAGTTPMELHLSLDGLYVRANGLSNNQLAVNGPADATNGGLFLFGFTIPEYYKIRNSRRNV